MFEGLSRLPIRQQQQFHSWVRAAEALNSSAGRDYRLPSPQHEELLRGARLLSGQDWPLEYCSLEGGHGAVRHIKQVVKTLQQVAVPHHRELAEVGDRCGVAGTLVEEVVGGGRCAVTEAAPTM
jgi:hypothetical protein